MRLVKFRGKWCVYWRDETGGRRVSLGTADKEEAERLFRDWQSDQRRARPLVTIGQIIESYLEDRAAAGVNTDNLRHAWKKAGPVFDHLEPAHITRELCREYIHRCRREGVKDSTTRKRLGVLSAAIRWHDPNSPAVIERPQLPAPRDRYLTRDEAASLLETTDAPHLKLFIVLALTTAARKTALLELTWDRVDLDRGRIDLGAGSGTKGRARVPINATARDALVQAREAATSDYVIEFAGGPVGDIKKGFARACARAGLEGVSPHILRHTAAVWMAEARVPMTEISQYLGHSSTAVTERVYARYSPEYLAQAAGALELIPGSNEHKISSLRLRKSLKNMAGP